MPSPVAHALGGLAAGWLVCAPRDRRLPPHAWRTVAALTLAGCAPDLDLLFGAHRGLTHTAGAAVIAGLAAFALTRRLRWGAAVAAAWGSHLLLDWLGTDTSPPIGIMALWPMTRTYYESSLHLFPSVSRRYWLAEFWYDNWIAVRRELLILGPVAAVVLWLGLSARASSETSSRT